MIIHKARIVSLLYLVCLTGRVLFSQPQSSRNNYTGAWETPASWDPSWALPQANISGYDITINGYITANTSLSFSATASTLYVDDTLVVNGNLTLDNNNDLTINNNGILIIRGNLTINNQTAITANGYLIVTGDIIKVSSVYQGSFTSNDNPVKVFIGGVITSSGLTTNNPDYPVLNCPAPETNPYPNSSCSYGNMTDIINDPVYSFFQSTCTIADVNSNSPVCAGSSINLTSTGGTSYSWSGPGGFTSSAQNLSIPSADMAMTGTYTVTVTAATGCKVQASTDVTVNELPLVFAGTDAIISNGTSTAIDASVTGSGPFTYSWSPPGLLVNSSIEDPTTVNLTTTTVFTLLASSATTSCSGTDDVAIIISGGPLVSDPSAAPESVCTGEEVQLHALAGGGSGSYTYNWTSTPAGFSSTDANPKASPTVNTTFHVAVSDGFTTVNAQVAVTVNEIPVTPTIVADGPTAFCAGESVTLSSSAGAAFFWSTGETTQSITVSTSGSYSVQVTSTSNCQSAVSAPVSTIVNELPIVNITSSSSAMCLNDLRTLTGDPAGGTFRVTEGPGTLTGNILSANGIGYITLVYSFSDVCTSESMQSIYASERPVVVPGPDQELNAVFETRMNAELSPDETGEWSLVSGSGNLSDLSSPTTMVTELSTGENVFLWKVGNGSCEESAEVRIIVNDLFVPSVITPNGDGKNDCFGIGEITDLVELIIFDRWGNEEFTNDNYLNDWCGRNNHGEELPADTYFYVLKFGNGTVIKGSVLILR
jgi:gliding motility-associated-like protein